MLPSISQTTSTLLIDDRPIVRAGLGTWLRGSGKFHPIHEATTAVDGFSQVAAKPPQLVIVGMRLPDATTAEIFRALHPYRWNTYTVLFSALIGDDDLLLAARVGARAILHRSISESEFLTTIDQVLAGENVLLASLPTRIRDQLHVKDLTPTEFAILGLIARGRTNREICGITGRTANTVKVHIRNIFPKLGVTNRSEAASVAIRRGIVD